MQRILVSILFALAVFTANNSILWADFSDEERSEKTLSPYFFVNSDDPSVDQLPLLHTSAEVNIAGVIADVTVTQLYKNEGKHALEAVYVFPGSTRAAVYGMTMTVGEQKISAQIKEKGQARQEYEQAKHDGKTASLLEQQRPNVFQMNVANILPGDVIKVELRYTELLAPTDGVYEFVYPTVVGPRYANHSPDSGQSDNWVTNPYMPSEDQPPYLFDITTHLSAGLPIQDVSCNSHRVSVAYDSKTTATITLADEEILETIQKLPPQHLKHLSASVKELYGKDFGNLPKFYQKIFRLTKAKQEQRVVKQRNVKAFGGDRDYIVRYRLSGQKIESGMLLYEGEDENFFLLMAQPPQRVKNAEIPPREYIFVMDASGSMEGFPIETAKTVLRDLIGNLRPSDTFNVLLFANSSTLLSEQSLPATSRNLKKAIDMIEENNGSGGTELLPALQRALNLPRAKEGTARTCVIVTDGLVTVETEAFELIRKHLDETNVFAFGIGEEVNRFLIEGIARVGQGEPFVVTNPDEAPSKATAFREYIQTPLLTQIQCDFSGFEAYDIEPVSVSDMLAERPVIVFGKWKGAPTGTVTISGYSGKGRYRETFEMAQIEPQASHAALRYLWARKRIELLGDYNQLDQSDRRVKAITQLGLQYNLLTEYTAFLAIDEEVRRQDATPPQTVKQPLPKPNTNSKKSKASKEKPTKSRPSSSYDDVPVSTPEPGTFVLLGLGVTMLIGGMRLRKRNTLSK